MDEPRVPLWDRLPELYRQRDLEQSPQEQLKSFLGLIERVLGDVHANIESLYHDFFIETCDDWVIPYIGDLLGTSHLAGDPATLRADVADTILLRRRKGTRGAIELLAHDLTRWPAHAVELFDKLAWTQHINHQRPDAGGDPPYANAGLRKLAQGGYVNLRDPAALSLLDTPFDPFAHFADVKPPGFGQLRYNLPDLAIFLWRLAENRVRHSLPVSRGVQAAGAVWVARFDVHPLGARLQLFNRSHYDPDVRPLMVTDLDGVPGPILPQRLDSRPAIPGTDAIFGVPDKYVTLTTWDPSDLTTLTEVGLGLELQLPQAAVPAFDLTQWSFRGENLCAWETALKPPLGNREVAIDPVIGRIVIGVDTQAHAQALADLRVIYTYGSVGPVGAHPAGGRDAPAEFDGLPTQIIRVDPAIGSASLLSAIDQAGVAGNPLVVEIPDSGTYDFDAALLPGVLDDGVDNVALSRALILRAAPGQRPIIRLAQPLRFRPRTLGPNLTPLKVVLERLYLTPGEGFDPAAALIERAAVHSLELLETTLDPGGEQLLDPDLADTEKRGPAHAGMRLARGYGFPAGTDFPETPAVRLWRSISGALFIDADDYRLALESSIVDGAGGEFAISGAGGGAPGAIWGADTTLDSLTVFGRVRVQSVTGRGGIFVARLEALDNQHGCLKYCYFADAPNRLPQQHACVRGDQAFLEFTSDRFGHPAYCQLGAQSDFAIRERGPGDDEMGAFNFLLQAHKWRNLQIRFREFMPVGVRPLIVPVT
jgi:hypothetical protein